MKLTDLEPEFVKWIRKPHTFRRIVGDHQTWEQRGRPTTEVTEDCDFMHVVEAMTEAQGIQFECPCGEGHFIALTFEGRDTLPGQGSYDDSGKPSRWKVSGTGFHDLTLSPSVWIKTGCGWHGFVENGEVRRC